MVSGLFWVIPRFHIWHFIYLVAVDVGTMDAEVKVPSDQNPELSNVVSFKLGVNHITA